MYYNYEKIIHERYDNEEDAKLNEERIWQMRFIGWVCKKIIQFLSNNCIHQIFNDLRLETFQIIRLGKILVVKEFITFNFLSTGNL